MSKLFFGGVPTKLDVDKLMALDPQPDTQWSYAKIEEVIGEKHGTNRFRSITTAFCKRLFRERSLQTSAYGGAIHFLTDDESLNLGRHKFWRVGRGIGRTRRGLEAIDSTKLTTAEKRDTHNLLRRELEALHDSVAKSAKEIAAPAASSGKVLRLAI